MVCHKPQVPPVVGAARAARHKAPLVPRARQRPGVGGAGVAEESARGRGRGLAVDAQVDDWASPEERAAVEAAPFTPASALNVLTDVSDADAVRLGFTPRAAHPRDLVLCSVLVPPPISRPAIMASEGSRSRGQDDLTHRLQDLNKRCIELRAWLAGRVDPMHDGGGWRDGASWRADQTRTHRTMTSGRGCARLGQSGQESRRLCRSGQGRGRSLRSARVRARPGVRAP